VVLVPLISIDWYFDDLGFLKARYNVFMVMLTLIAHLLSDVM